jgi:hypothetical protein
LSGSFAARPALLAGGLALLTLLFAGLPGRIGTPRRRSPESDGERACKRGGEPFGIAFIAGGAARELVVSDARLEALATGPAAKVVQGHGSVRFGGARFHALNYPHRRTKLGHKRRLVCGQRRRGRYQLSIAGVRRRIAISVS